MVMRRLPSNPGASKLRRTCGFCASGFWREAVSHERSSRLQHLDLVDVNQWNMNDSIDDAVRPNDSAYGHERTGHNDKVLVDDVVGRSTCDVDAKGHKRSFLQQMFEFFRTHPPRLMVRHPLSTFRHRLQPDERCGQLELVCTPDSGFAVSTRVAAVEPDDAIG